MSADVIDLASGKPAPPPPARPQGRVYFVQAGEHGPIKIGWTRGDPAARIASLQTGNPFRLILLVAVPGSVEDEASLHLRFDRIRMTGEWFQPTSELVAFIAAIQWTQKARETVTEALDEVPAPDSARPAPALPCAVCEEKRSTAARWSAWETTLLRRARRAVQGSFNHEGIRKSSPKLRDDARFALGSLGDAHECQLCHDLASVISTLWEAP